jgi:glycosyltransferase involved in cell wall biosynthesis
MACGTPVVALSRGSVPEVVDEGVTGFTTTNPYQLARLVKLAVKLDRPLVRKQAEARFGVKAMVDGYEAMFLDAIGLGR